MTDCTRRMFLKGSGAASLLGLGVGLGLVRPARALTGPAWPAAAFGHKDVTGAVHALFGATQAVPNGAVALEVAELAEDGSNVPLAVHTSLPGVQSIAILVDKNPFPLVALLHVGPGAAPSLKTRIKMNKTSPVRAYVRTADRLYVATHTVKVTVGGCGG